LFEYVPVHAVVDAERLVRATLRERFGDVVTRIEAGEQIDRETRSRLVAAFRAALDSVRQGSDD